MKKAILISLLAAIALPTSASTAKIGQKKIRAPQINRVITDRVQVYAGSIDLSARRRYGSCDGIHRCLCGSTQTAHFGLPRIYNGHNLWQAREWGRAFPRTSYQAGAIGVKPHHVFRVVQPLSNGRAIVADDRGTHEYNIRGAIFVDPNGNGVRPTRVASHRHRHYRHYASRHRYSHTAYAQYYQWPTN